MKNKPENDMYHPYPRKKPEQQKPNPPKLDIPEEKGMSLQEHYATRRPSFLMNHWNIETEVKRRRRVKFIYGLLLVIALVVTLIWAFTR
jgi:hypothetical protein